MNKEEIHSKGDIKAYLIQDEDAMNPFEDTDTLGTLVTWHPNYTFGGVDGKKEFGDPKYLASILKKEKLVHLPVYLLDHSGLTVNTTGFSCPWDSGQIGYIYITAKDWQEEYKDVRKSRKDCNTLAESILRHEIEALDQLLTGDVWGIVIEKDVKCDKCGNESEAHLDSCWGFFGYEYAKQECKRMFDAVIKQEVAA